MNNMYKKPEFMIVKMTVEDILTDSHLENFSSSFETGTNIVPGDDLSPFIEI